MLRKNKLQYVTMCVMIFLTIEIFLVLRKVTKMRRIVQQQAHELGLQQSKISSQQSSIISQSAQISQMKS